MTTPTTPPIGHVAHFAVNSDDLAASRRFYTATFGWTFEPWGPPEFFHIRAADGGQPGTMAAALQGRRNFDDLRVCGFECTVAVPDADAAAAAAVAAGGGVLMPTTTITGVGDLTWLLDPSGNPVGAMRYDTTAE